MAAELVTQPIVHLDQHDIPDLAWIKVEVLSGRGGGAQIARLHLWDRQGCGHMHRRALNAPNCCGTEGNSTLRSIPQQQQRGPDWVNVSHRKQNKRSYQITTGGQKLCNVTQDECQGSTRH